MTFTAQFTLIKNSNTRSLHVFVRLDSVLSSSEMKSRWCRWCSPLTVCHCVENIQGVSLSLSQRIIERDKRCFAMCVSGKIPTGKKILSVISQLLVSSFSHDVSSIYCIFQCAVYLNTTTLHSMWLILTVQCALNMLYKKRK